MQVPDHFETARLHARRVRLSDLPYIVSVDTDPQMVPWLTGSISTQAESEARVLRWIDEERQTGLGFWIFSADGQDVGHGGLFHSKRDPGFIELGYAVLPAFWGRGYASEMARAFLDMADESKMRSIVALTRETNLGSRRVLEKCGLRFVGGVHADGIDFVRYVYA